MTGATGFCPTCLGWLGAGIISWSVSTQHVWQSMPWASAGLIWPEPTELPVWSLWLGLFGLPHSMAAGFLKQVSMREDRSIWLSCHLTPSRYGIPKGESNLWFWPSAHISEPPKISQHHPQCWGIIFFSEAALALILTLTIKPTVSPHLTSKIIFAETFVHVNCLQREWFSFRALSSIFKTFWSLWGWHIIIQISIYWILFVILYLGCKFITWESANPNSLQSVPEMWISWFKDTWGILVLVRSLHGRQVNWERNPAFSIQP